MKFLIFGFLLVVASVASQDARGKLFASRSLEGLFMEFIARLLNDAQDQYRSIAGIFDNTDMGNEKTLSDAFSSVPCNDLCQVCFEFKGDRASEKCENHCEDTCHWDYGEGDESPEMKRAIIDACLGFPDGFRFSFGGISALLKSLPIIGGK